MKRVFGFSVLLQLLFVFGVSGDTFTNDETGEVLHGYALNKKINSQTMVKTDEKGFVRLKLSKWTVEYNEKGRDQKVIVIPFDKELKFPGQVKALKDSIEKALNNGPLFVLLEIDSAGGNIGLAIELGSVVSRGSNYTPIYSYVKADQTKGAINAAAIPVLASKKVFIEPRAVIGGIMVEDSNDPNEKSQYEYFNMRELLGKNVGEKITSVYRAHIASLAIENERPQLIAMAMMDNEVEVIETSQGNGREFVEPVNLKEGQEKIKVWSQKGKLLLIDANDAVELGIADEKASSRDDVIAKIAGKTMEQEIEDSHSQVYARLKDEIDKLEQIAKDIQDYHEKYRKADRRQKKALLLRMIRGYNTVFAIANRSPELELNLSYVKMWQDQLEMEYKSL